MFRAYLVVFTLAILTPSAFATLDVQRVNVSQEGTFTIAVDGGATLKGRVDEGQQVSVTNQGVTAVVRMYPLSRFITVILSVDGDPTAGIAILAPPTYQKLNCAPIVALKESASQDVASVLSELQKLNHWESQQALRQVAAFFATPGNERMRLDDFYTQVDEGRIRAMVADRNCNGSPVSPPRVATADPTVQPLPPAAEAPATPTNATVGAPLELHTGGMSALPTSYPSRRKGAPAPAGCQGDDMNGRRDCLASMIRANSAAPVDPNDPSTLAPWKIEELRRIAPRPPQ